MGDSHRVSGLVSAWGETDAVTIATTNILPAANWRQVRTRPAKRLDLKFRPRVTNWPTGTTATDRRYLIRVENVSEPSAAFACSSRFAAKNGWNDVPAASSAW